MPSKITFWSPVAGIFPIIFQFVSARSITREKKNSIVFRGTTVKQSLETIILCVYGLWNEGKPPTNRSVFTQVLIMTKTISYTLEWIREQTEGEMEYRQVPAAISWE